MLAPLDNEDLNVLYMTVSIYFEEGSRENLKIIHKKIRKPEKPTFCLQQNEAHDRLLPF